MKTYGDLIDYVQSHDGPTIREIADAADASYGTAHYRIGKLITAGALELVDRRLYTAADDPAQVATAAGIPPHRPLDNSAWAAMRRKGSSVSRLEAVVERLEAVADRLEAADAT